MTTRGVEDHAHTARAPSSSLARRERTSCAQHRAASRVSRRRRAYASREWKVQGEDVATPSPHSRTHREDSGARSPSHLAPTRPAERPQSILRVPATPCLVPASARAPPGTTQLITRGGQRCDRPTARTGRARGGAHRADDRCGCGGRVYVLPSAGRPNPHRAFARRRDDARRSPLDRDASLERRRRSLEMGRGRAIARVRTTASAPLWTPSPGLAATTLTPTGASPCTTRRTHR